MYFHNTSCTFLVNGNAVTEQKASIRTRVMSEPLATKEKTCSYEDYGVSSILTYIVGSSDLLSPLAWQISRQASGVSALNTPVRVPVHRPVK